VDLMIAAKRKRAEAAHLWLPDRRILRPDRRVLHPRQALPGIAPLPRGLRAVVPGSSTYSTAGSNTFVFPYCDTFSIDMYAPGGGGGGAAAYNNGVIAGSAGSAGGYMQFYRDGICNLVAYGGNGGSAGAYPQTSPGQAAHGTAVGGQGNVTGGGRAGGSAGSTNNNSSTNYGYHGGTGARVYSTFTNCRAWEGLSFSLIVGGAGSQGANGSSPWWPNVVAPTAGVGPGIAYISWS
jgi:hypothetical protein